MKSESERIKVHDSNKELRKVLKEIGYKPDCKTYYCTFRRCLEWSMGKTQKEMEIVLEDKDRLIEAVADAGLHAYRHNGGYWSTWRRCIEWILR